MTQPEGSTKLQPSFLFAKMVRVKMRVFCQSLKIFESERYSWKVMIAVNLSPLSAGLRANP